MSSLIFCLRSAGLPLFMASLTHVSIIVWARSSLPYAPYGHLR